LKWQHNHDPRLARRDRLGGAKPVDVLNIVERVLFRQNAGSVLLRVNRPPYDEAGHVEIEVLEIGPPSEKQFDKQQENSQ
jgi:hypothetical protein